jgi:hypothetical protein
LRTRTGLKEELMTTPQQPGADPQGEAEVIEDLETPADTQQQVAGGVDKASPKLDL